MKILFYLPVVTPWWFSNIITPMLRTLHAEAELHIMIAPLWSSTGLESDHLLPLSDLEHIQWHIIDHDDPAAFRLNGASIPGLLDLVHEIAPDLTICRSADQATPALFPGTVRYIMEGGAAPIDTDRRCVIFEEKLFSFGLMPKEAEEMGDQCARVLAPLWQYAEHEMSIQPPFGWRNHWGLPHDRPILCVPLQYEHEEDFFVGNSASPHAIELISSLLDSLGDRAFLAVTDHPLNRNKLDRSALDALIAANADRARLCQSNALPLGSTGLFARYADAMLIDQSKCWSLAAFCGTPILRIGTTPIADWVSVSDDLAKFPQGLRGTDRAAARRWFGYHLGVRLLDPNLFSLDELMARVNGRIDPNMVAVNLDMVLDRLPREAAA